MLEKLPYRFVDMAGSGPDADGFARVLSFDGLTPRLARTNAISATPAPMAVALTDLPAAPDGNVFRLYGAWDFFQGPKTGNASSVFYPAYRLLSYTYPGSQAKSFVWPVAAKLSGMTSKSYVEFTLMYVDRNDQQILSKVSFN